MPVPRTQEQINEMIKMISPERVSTRNVEQVEGVPVPKIMEETTEVIQWYRRSTFKRTSLKNHRRLGDPTGGGCAISTDSESAR